jgi:hypothetical protein
MTEFVPPAPTTRIHKKRTKKYGNLTSPDPRWIATIAAKASTATIAILVMILERLIFLVFSVFSGSFKLEDFL